MTDQAGREIRACVLQHIRCEPPGIFTGVLRRPGIAIETVELEEGDKPPRRPLSLRGRPRD